MSFANLEGADSTEAFFSQLGSRPYEFEIYKALATFYIHQERYIDAANSYQTFINNNPLHPQAPNFNAAIIDVYQMGDFPSLILPIKEQFVSQYGIDSDYWKKATENDRNPN